MCCHITNWSLLLYKNKWQLVFTGYFTSKWSGAKSCAATQHFCHIVCVADGQCFVPETSRAAINHFDHIDSVYGWRLRGKHKGEHPAPGQHTPTTLHWSVITPFLDQPKLQKQHVCHRVVISLTFGAAPENACWHFDCQRRQSCPNLDTTLLTYLCHNVCVASAQSEGSRWSKQNLLLQVFDMHFF